MTDCFEIVEFMRKFCRHCVHDRFNHDEQPPQCDILDRLFSENHADEVTENGCSEYKFKQWENKK